MESVDFNELVKELKHSNRHLFDALERVESMLADGTLNSETLEFKEGVK